MALAVDNLTSLLAALGRQTVISDGLEEFREDVRKRWDKEDRLAMDQSRWKVLGFFGKVNPQQNHDMSLRLHHPGTGLW